VPPLELVPLFLDRVGRSWKRVLACGILQQTVSDEDIPFISNNLPETVNHAIVAIFSHAFARLDLSLGVSRAAFTIAIQ
jgi:hypothetical protein